MVQLFPLFPAILALSLTTVTASPRQIVDNGAKAAYFQSNKSPNNIVAVKIESGGKIGEVTFHPTGGLGGAELTATGPHLPDSLGSQNSVVVFGDFLFNANAGSNEISLFHIPPEDPTGLNLIGKYPVNGDFPNTIAVKDNLLCAGYTGARSGVSCAPWGPWGIGGFDTLRGFNINQQNPPNASLALVSDAFFAKDDSNLVVTVRGAPGFVAIYPVEWNGHVSAMANDAIPSGVAASFGGVPVSKSSHIFVSEPRFGGYILDLDKPETPISTITVPGQKAICWAAITSKFATGILPDAGTSVITQVDLLSGKILQQWNSTNGNAGNLDFAISADDKLYALAFNPADTQAWVASFDVSGKFADIDNVAIAGTDMFSQGFAVYPTMGNFEIVI